MFVVSLASMMFRSSCLLCAKSALSCVPLPVSNVYFSAFSVHRTFCISFLCSFLQFIHQVVSLVLAEDRSEAPWDDALDRVQTKLNVWKGELHRLDELDELRRRILKTLRKRAQIVYDRRFGQGIQPLDCLGL